jgi:uncharacterized protein YkwD
MQLVWWESSHLYKEAHLKAILTTFKTIMQIIKVILSAVTLVSLASCQPVEKRGLPSQDDINQILNTHNDFRKQHSAPALTWDPKLADFANNLVDKCVFAHSGVRKLKYIHNGIKIDFL